MSKRILSVAVLLVAIALNSSATIRRVGYGGLPVANVDYPNLQAANDAAVAGDTIQVYGAIAAATINKKVVLIGFGYNFDVHPGLQTTNANTPSDIASTTFGSGSNGTVVTGISGSFYIHGNAGDTISNLTFNRCYGTFYLVNYQDYGFISNIKILSSVIAGGGMQYNSVSDRIVNNLQVFNSYVESFNLYKTGTTASFINCVCTAPSIVGSRAINFNDASVLLKNSIIPGHGSQNINTVFENDLFAEAQPAPLPVGSNNKWGQDWSVIFNRINSADNASYVYYNEFDENYFVLKSGSPAKNAGLNGSNQPTDCGIFGGEPAFVYKPSGVPAVPSIYKLSANGISATANPYNVTLSVRSNN